MRTVVLHYHLFKNAGTSVDRVLQNNFSDRWISREFPGHGGNNTALVRDWIDANPGICAFSSHTMLGPLPRITGTRIVPILLLRDPVSRILSAYHFERRQKADTKGARLARKHDLMGYVTARLSMPGDRQCRNFQTGRLAGMIPGDGAEAIRARKAVELLRANGAIGLVSEFDRVLLDLANRLKGPFPNFDATPVRTNVATRCKPRIPAKVLDILMEANRDDMMLVDYLRKKDAAA